MSSALCKNVALVLHLHNPPAPPVKVYDDPKGSVRANVPNVPNDLCTR
jgi:hypothetical protein